MKQAPHGSSYRTITSNLEFKSIKETKRKVPKKKRKKTIDFDYFEELQKIL